jgi:hypothetical protein
MSSLPSEFLTPAEVAAILKVTPKHIISKFKDRSGVIDVGSNGGETRFKRGYKVLRISREALNRFIVESRVQ